MIRFFLPYSNVLTAIYTGLGAQKILYILSFITNSGMDLNDNNSQWVRKV
ncbi:MAG: hypothetical protein IPG00_02925 [Saprospiraceae bacterium]|nr:hypothetical protein [Saprospiraceae bacterium]